MDSLDYQVIRDLSRVVTSTSTCYVSAQSGKVDIVISSRKRLQENPVTVRYSLSSGPSFYSDYVLRRHSEAEQW